MIVPDRLNPDLQFMSILLGHALASVFAAIFYASRLHALNLHTVNQVRLNTYRESGPFRDAVTPIYLYMNDYLEILVW